MDSAHRRRPSRRAAATDVMPISGPPAHGRAFAALPAGCGLIADLLAIPRPKIGPRSTPPGQNGEAWERWLVLSARSDRRGPTSRAWPACRGNRDGRPRPQRRRSVRLNSHTRGAGGAISAGYRPPMVALLLPCLRAAPRRTVAGHRDAPLRRMTGRCLHFGKCASESRAGAPDAPRSSGFRSSSPAAHLRLCRCPQACSRSPKRSCRSIAAR